jgi:cyclic pyranopterin phosphate synthase
MSGGRAGPRHVMDGIEAAVRAGLTPVKVNCVVQRGVNDAGIVELARAFQGTGVILRFIEFMDVGTLNGWDLAHVVPAREILERLDAELPLEPVLRGYRGEVASRYRYRDGSGEIGLISSVSQPFCGDCTRARLSTDGKLVTCLFAAGGTDLRAPLRAGASDDELRAKISAVWRLRRDRYSEERAAQTALPGPSAPRRKIEMYQIGG